MLCTCLGVGILAAQDGVEPQLYADSPQVCPLRDPLGLVRAAEFALATSGLVGQEPRCKKKKCAF